MCIPPGQGTNKQGILFQGRTVLGAYIFQAHWLALLLLRFHVRAIVGTLANKQWPFPCAGVFQKTKAFCATYLFCYCFRERERNQP